jgi:hypothetical protein
MSRQAAHQPRSPPFVHDQQIEKYAPMGAYLAGNMAKKEFL